MKIINFILSSKFIIMKTSFSLLFICLIFNFAICQINPVQNLEWSQGYSEPYNIFSLYWDEPEQPHDELIGYNIYREDELYKFQTETGMFCTPEFGEYDDCDFIDGYLGEEFTGYVAAVYEGGVESEYVSFYVWGAAIGVNDIDFQQLKVYPNPARDFLQFGKKVFEISIIDMNGKVIKSIPEADAIDISRLADGNYIVRFSDQNGKLYYKRFLKN